MRYCNSRKSCLLPYSASGKSCSVFRPALQLQAAKRPSENAIQLWTGMHTNQNRQCHRTIREDSSSTVDGTFTEHKFQVNFKAAGLAIFFAKIWSRLFRTSYYMDLQPYSAGAVIRSSRGKDSSACPLYRAIPSHISGITYCPCDGSNLYAEAHQTAVCIPD